MGVLLFYLMPIPTRVCSPRFELPLFSDFTAGFEVFLTLSRDEMKYMICYRACKAIIISGGEDLAKRVLHLACHSAGMVLNQPASKAQWQAEVEKMRQAYKAPVDPKDVDAIVDYLVSIRGAS
jgi:hypothetical protein